MIDLFTTHSNITDIANLFVNALGAKISRTTLQKEIEEHPFYPSLLSISEVLTSFGVKNVTAKFQLSKITEIPAPFMVQMKSEDNSNYFSLVRRNDSGTVDYYMPELHKWNKVSIDTFISKCTGIVLMAETQMGSGEKNYAKEKRKENNLRIFKYFSGLIFPLLLVLQGSLTYLQSGSVVLIPLLFSIFFTVGSIISFLLVWHDLDQFNPASQAICAAGKKINCNAVLASKGGEVLGIKWSVIGFSYFVGGLIFILTSGLISWQPFSLLAKLNFIATLYVFYSVYYQWKIAKNWCPLCLSVQLILVLITLTGYLVGFYHSFGVTLSLCFQMIPPFILTFIGINIIYSTMLKNKDYKSGKLELQRSKRNPDNLRTSLSSQKAIHQEINGLGIILGNPLSANKIIKVCNPYCGPCASVHESIKELLNNSDDLSIQIIFTATNDNNDARAMPVRHFLALDQEGKVDMERVLEDWYHAEIKDYSIFAAKYPLDSVLLSNQNKKIDQMREWASNTQISFTPTFFINGHQLPPNYTISDLKYYFID